MNLEDTDIQCCSGEGGWSATKGFTGKEDGILAGGAGRTKRKDEDVPTRPSQEEGSFRDSSGMGVKGSWLRRLGVGGGQRLVTRAPWALAALLEKQHFCNPI